MPGQLAGKTITITTTKNKTVDEIVELVRTAFGGTACRGCTSGGYLVLREGTEVQTPASANANIVVTEQH
jgi:hypothetical protein